VRTELDVLENRTDALAEAVSVLVRGLEDIPVGSARDEHVAHAAQQAHRILLAHLPDQRTAHRSA
jgi:hypothetical protein